MNGFIAFTKKEFLEQIRTFKTFILLAVLFLFGMTSPLLAKIMPQILSSIDMQGVMITMPDPTYLDSYTQFFKNMTQMGMLALLLIFSGMLSQELTKGTLVNMLSKGLSRSSVILSKYTASLILWTVSFTLAALTNYGYTFYLFGSHNVTNIFFSCLCLWLFGALVLALILLTSILTKGNYGGLLLTVMVLGILLTANIFPAVSKYDPIILASYNTALLSNTVSISDVLPAVWVTLFGILLSLVSASVLFKKKKI